MSHGDYLSPDRIARRDEIRRLIRQLAGQHDVDLERMGRLCGYTKQRWGRVMTRGETASPSLADVVLLSDTLGREHELLHALVHAAGYRLVRDVEAAPPTEGGELLASAAGALRDLSRLVARTAALLPLGVTPEEARAITAELDEVRRRIGMFEADLATVVKPVVANAVVPTLRRVR